MKEFKVPVTITYDDSIASDIINLTDAQNYMAKAYDAMAALNQEYMDYLMQEIEAVPNDEMISLPAGTLKSLFNTMIALEAGMMGNMEAVKRYLEAKELI